MDSPPLSKLMNNVEIGDESFGDLSLPSADSPAPLRTNTLRGTGFGSLLNRRPPTRNFEETPDATRTLSGRNNCVLSSSTSGPGTGTDRSRKSLFGLNPSHSLKSSTSHSFGSRREPEAAVMAEDDREEPEIEENEEEGEEEGDGDGDRTVTIDQEEQQTAAGRAAREERLKDSLYELRGINDTFEMFLEALESARGHNQVSPHLVSIRLDKY